MNPKDHAQVALLFIAIGMRVLSARIVLIVAMLLTFSLFAWAMFLPGWERVAAATIFAVLVFIPATWIDKAQSGERSIITPKDTP